MNQPSPEPVPAERVNVLGVGVSPINLSQAIQTIEAWIAAKRARYVCVTGVHGIMESRRDPALRQIHNAAGLVTPDGMPLVWISRMRGVATAGRVYGPDLMLACCDAFRQRGVRHFFYGGAPGVSDELARRLRARFPGLDVAGCFSPPFGAVTPAEDEAIVRRIKAGAPDIVWVGLSTPKQERWMASHVEPLHPAVLIGVGAAFDFHAGRKPQAPRVLQRIGLEWAFRMATEPRRLAGRYLRNNPLFIYHLLRQAGGGRGYDLEP
jgi:N-acetylglucosaminyldiphosphoundecaprenol N-acetyl-beta-D-mannosaminyltransferase